PRGIEPHRFDALEDDLDGRLSQLLDYHDVALRRHDRKHCRATGLFSRDRHSNSARIPRARTRSPQATKTTRTAQSGDTRVHFDDEECGGDQSPGFGIRILHLVDQTTGSSPREGYWYWLQRRPVDSDLASPWLLYPASQAHDERQTRRGSLSASRR